MANIIMPPSDAILRATGFLEEAINRFPEANSQIPNPGMYESDVEAHLLILLIIRHVQGVITLARHDLVLLPAATAIARTSFEAAVRVLWVLNPHDPMQREARWLAGLKEYESYYRNLATDIEKHQDDGAPFHQIEKEIQGFRLGVERLLPKEIELLSKQPKYEDMLKDLGDAKRYTSYRIMSNYTHPTQVATSIYRSGLGTQKKFGEFISPSDWYTCLGPAWFSLANAGFRFLERCGGDPSAFLNQEFVDDVNRAIEAVRLEKNPQHRSPPEVQ